MGILFYYLILKEGIPWTLVAAVIYRDEVVAVSVEPAADTGIPKIKEVYNG